MLNGYGRPVFEIIDPKGNFVKKIILPECNSTSGVSKDKVLYQTVHEMHNGRIDIKDRGIREVTILDYTEYIDDNGKELIDEILNYQADGFKLMFYARDKAQQLKYEALILKGYKCRQCINASFNTGWELIELEVTSKYLLTRHTNIDVDNLTTVTEEVVTSN